MNVYLRMASNPTEFQGTPFGFRIGQPWLAHLLASTLDRPANHVFALITAFFTVISAILIGWWLMYNKIDDATVYFLLGVHFFTYPGAFLTKAWGLVDSALFLFVVLGIFVAQAKEIYWLCGVLFVGSFFKENIAIILPAVAMIRFDRDRKIKWFAETCVSVLAFVVPFILLRLTIDGAREGAINFYSREYFAHVIDYWGGLYGALSKIFFVFSSLWVIFLYSAWRYRGEMLIRSLVVLLALAIMQMIFATDIERMVLMGAPVMYLLVGKFCENKSTFTQGLMFVFPVISYNLFVIGSLYKYSVIAGVMISLVLIYLDFKSKKAFTSESAGI